MAFAQLTYRESLRDIEVCLAAQQAKLYHMGIREPVGSRYPGPRPQQLRDCASHVFAQTLIAQARKL